MERAPIGDRLRRRGRFGGRRIDLPKFAIALATAPVAEAMAAPGLWAAPDGGVAAGAAADRTPLGGSKTADEGGCAGIGGTNVVAVCDGESLSLRCARRRSL